MTEKKKSTTARRFREGKKKGLLKPLAQESFERLGQKRRMIVATGSWEN